MKITFIGVGEATDAKPNTSILIEGESNLLLDCGYSVPPALWQYSTDPNLIDTVYISHLHADHFFGLAPLFLRMVEGKRVKPVTVICPKGYEQLIQQSLDLAFGEIFEHQEFTIQYLKVAAGDKVAIGEYSLTFAPTTHLRGNLAVRITDGERVLCYSGDGKMTPASKALFDGCDMLIHDAFHEYNKPAGQPMGHESIESLIEYQQSHAIKLLACVHIGKNENDVAATYQEKSRIFPHSGESIEI